MDIKKLEDKLKKLIKDEELYIRMNNQPTGCSNPYKEKIKCLKIQIKTLKK